MRESLISSEQQVRSKRLRLAELTSSLGAGVLGLGLGLLLRSLPIGALPVLVVGLAMHGWGMLDKHRLERGVLVETWWSKAAYWACWLILIGLTASLFLRWLNR